MVQFFFIETMFSEEGNASFAFRKGLRVESCLGGETVFWLWTYVLESDNGRIGRGFARESVSIGLAVGCGEGDA